MLSTPPVQHRSATTWLAVALAWLCVFGAAHPAQAHERIWGAVLLGSNVENPKPPVPELERVARKAQKLFGFNQVELLGSATKEFVPDGSERRLNPTQRLWLAVKTKRGDDDDNYLVHLWLFKDDTSLVEIQAKLGERCPLVIQGPKHPRGQVLVALQVLD